MINNKSIVNSVVVPITNYYKVDNRVPNILCFDIAGAEIKYTPINVNGVMLLTVPCPEDYMVKVTVKRKSTNLINNAAYSEPLSTANLAKTVLEHTLYVVETVRKDSAIDPDSSYFINNSVVIKPNTFTTNTNKPKPKPTVSSKTPYKARTRNTRV